MKLTTEQLTKIVEENKESAKKLPAKNANDVHRFIVALGIKEGKHKVSTKVVYKAYKMWSGKPYTVKAFFKRFCYYFQRHISNSSIYYYLNYSAVELINKVDNGLIKF